MKENGYKAWQTMKASRRVLKGPRPVHNPLSCTRDMYELRNRNVYAC